MLLLSFAGAQAAAPLAGTARDTGAGPGAAFATIALVTLAAERRRRC
jgi:hypothetical protein